MKKTFESIYPMAFEEGQRVLQRWLELKSGDVLLFEKEKDSGKLFAANYEDLQSFANRYKLLKAKVSVIQKELWSIINNEYKLADKSPRAQKLSRDLQAEFGEIKHKIYSIDSTITDIEERVQESRIMTQELQNFSIDSVVSSCISFPELERENYGQMMLDHVHELHQEETNSISSGLEDYFFVREIRPTLQGKIIEAVSKSSGEKVAIKVCRKELIASGKSLSGKTVLEDPYQESKLMKILQNPGHPNVLRIIDSFSTSEEYCIVLEYAGRGEFFDIISQVGRLDEEVAKGYFLEMAKGLKYIHDRSICHLDLSLENILMGSDGSVLIADFGLSRAFLSGKPFTNDELQKPGKIQYMAPEIYLGDEFYGNECDCFSLGVILFIMLAGFPPFDTPSLSDRRFAMIMKGRSSLMRLIRKWKLDAAISDQAVDVLASLLCPREQRKSMDDILVHEWLFDAQVV